jgi:hypothetical protein
LVFGFIVSAWHEIASQFAEGAAVQLTNRRWCFRKQLGDFFARPAMHIVALDHFDFIRREQFGQRSQDARPVNLVVEKRFQAQRVR